jgi:hypothetical protein
MGVQKTNAQNKPALIPYPQQLDLKGGNLVIPAEAFYLIQDSVFNPDFEWFKHELAHNAAFREKFGPPIVSDNFQIGPDGAYEHED